MKVIFIAIIVLLANAKADEGDEKTQTDLTKEVNAKATAQIDPAKEADTTDHTEIILQKNEEDTHVDRIVVGDRSVISSLCCPFYFGHTQVEKPISNYFPNHF